MVLQLYVLSWTLCVTGRVTQDQLDRTSEALIQFKMLFVGKQVISGATRASASCASASSCSAASSRSYVACANTASSRASGLLSASLSRPRSNLIDMGSVTVGPSQPSRNIGIFDRMKSAMDGKKKDTIEKKKGRFPASSNQNPS